MMSRRLTPLALLLTACTASSPVNKATPDQVPGVPAVPVVPVVPAVPVVAANPAVPVVAANPAVPVVAANLAVPAAGEPAASWWCICYARTTATGGEPVTACRDTEGACHGLERAIGAGRSGLVAGSQTRKCAAVTAAHPGDVYGGQEAWQPSKKAGGWLSIGECRLPGEDESVHADGEGTMVDDNIGGLKQGMSAEAVLEKFGEPGKRGRISLEEATGTYVQRWDYEAQGLVLTMGSAKRNGPQTIYDLTIRAPSGDQDDVFIAGSVYGGVFFTFVSDKVTEIFIGAGAE